MVVLHSFVIMLLDAIGYVNINHFPCGVCKISELTPKCMEHFAKILTPILCKVTTFDSIRELLISEAINPQHRRN